MYAKLLAGGPLSNKANSRVLLNEMNNFGQIIKNRNKSKRPITAVENKGNQPNVKVRLASNSIL